MKRNALMIVLCLLLALSVALPAAAYDGQLSSASGGFGAEGNVVNVNNILTAEEELSLEQLISQISAQYNFGIYLFADNYKNYSENVVEAVIAIYHGQMLGYGADRDGILLLMDPYNREFAFFVYGAYAEYVFDAYGQEQLEQVFLDDFGADAWYNGFTDFVLECGSYLEQAAMGEPVRQSTTGYYVLLVVISLVIALAVTWILLSQMKSVEQANEASVYVIAEGLALTVREDQFCYMTQSVHDLSSDDDSSSSSGSFSGGGGSGRSGSF